MTEHELSHLLQQHWKLKDADICVGSDVRGVYEIRFNGYDVVELIAELIDKDIFTEPHYATTPVGERGFCPRCGVCIEYSIDGNLQHDTACYNCGQKINWDGVDDD